VLSLDLEEQKRMSPLHRLRERLSPHHRRQLEALELALALFLMGLLLPLWAVPALLLRLLAALWGLSARVLSALRT
jgi:hypothetical protein